MLPSLLNAAKEQDARGSGGPLQLSNPGESR
jgi:hypothetical protein